MTALSTATLGWRGAPATFVDSAWTWWIPYLGVFILGWALRGVVLRGAGLWCAAGGAVGLGALLAWQWRNPEAPSWLVTLAPTSYYGASVILYSVLVFLVFQGMFRAGGPMGVLLRPGPSRWARTLGDATLGVFALHLTVLLFVLEMPVIGGGNEASRALFLLARVVMVSVLTYGLVLLLRRVPVVRTLV